MYSQVENLALPLNVLNLTEESIPVWGTMTPQEMIEHLEYSFRIASGEIQDFEIETPEKILEKVHEFLYNHLPMQPNYGAPKVFLDRTSKLKHQSLGIAKQNLLDAYEEFQMFFKENKDARTKNAVFGELNKFEWDLCNTKHVNHHFKQFGLL